MTIYLGRFYKRTDVKKNSKLGFTKKKKNTLISESGGVGAKEVAGGGRML